MRTLFGARRLVGIGCIGSDLYNTTANKIFNDLREDFVKECKIVFSFLQ